jgi:hypothetical protein
VAPTAGAIAASYGEFQKGSKLRTAPQLNATKACCKACEQSKIPPHSERMALAIWEGTMKPGRVRCQYPPERGFIACSGSVDPDGSRYSDDYSFLHFELVRCTVFRCNLFRGLAVQLAVRNSVRPSSNSPTGMINVPTAFGPTLRQAFFRVLPVHALVLSCAHYRIKICHRVLKCRQLTRPSSKAQQASIHLYMQRSSHFAETNGPFQKSLP